MAIEPKRGCGYRKVGGIYLVADGPGVPCGRLPIPLTLCPTCGAGIKQTRGWTWVDLPPLVEAAGLQCQASLEVCFVCPLRDPRKIGRAGLLWIGEQFYPTPDHFTFEAATLGISRRIKAVPPGFKVGETWVLLAHPKTIRVVSEGRSHIAGIFRVFKPQRVEVIITESQSEDPVFVGRWQDGYTPVVVPDNDRDHQGTVYDGDEEEPRLLPLQETVN